MNKKILKINFKISVMIFLCLKYFFKHFKIFKDYMYFENYLI